MAGGAIRRRRSQEIYVVMFDALMDEP